MIVEPSGTSICSPSISISRGMADALQVIGHTTLLVLDVVHEFVAEMLDKALHRQRGSIAQRADGAPGNVVRDVIQQVEVLHPALAMLDTVDHAVEPAGALAARRALAAGFLEVKI